MWNYIFFLVINCLLKNRRLFCRLKSYEAVWGGLCVPPTRLRQVTALLVMPMSETSEEHRWRKRRVLSVCEWLLEGNNEGSQCLHLHDRVPESATGRSSKWIHQPASLWNAHARVRKRTEPRYSLPVNKSCVQPPLYLLEHLNRVEQEWEKDVESFYFTWWRRIKSEIKSKVLVYPFTLSAKAGPTIKYRHWSTPAPSFRREKKSTFWQNVKRMNIICHWKRWRNFIRMSLHHSTWRANYKKG